MAHFYAGVQGNRQMSTRVGTPQSGIKGFIQGWRAGVSVRGYVNEDGEDVFDISATSGSNGGKQSVFVGTVKETKKGFVFYPAKGGS